MRTREAAWRSSSLTLAACVAIAVSACGTGGDDGGDQPSPEQLEVVDVFYRFQQAAVDRDSEAVCDLVDEESISAFERVGGCESFFSEDTFYGTQEDVDALDVTDVEIRGDDARVTVEAEGTEDTMDFVREDGEWRVLVERTGFLE